MAVRGERFQLNLDDNADFLGGPTLPPNLTPASIIKDIIEHSPSSAPIPPSLPSRATATGFPEHKKRAPKQSAFRQQRRQQQHAQGHPPAAKQPTPRSPDEDSRSERQRISDENQARINAMSLEEIEKERRELMEKLSPTLIERLLKRATLDDENITPSGWNIEGSKLSRPMRAEDTTPPQQTSRNPPPKATVTSEEEEEEKCLAAGTLDTSQLPTLPDLTDDERAPLVLPPGAQLNPGPINLPIHFPQAPRAPELDPSDPSFLTALHEKYFPDLPADPSTLAWMKPLHPDEDSHEYHPSLTSLPASAFRFDFKGNLLPPRTSRELPTHLGLHHHGDAPNAAGYTIPELAHLARSTFPAQRCMAMQTLGRIMYRLGTGAYGQGEIEEGLGRCLEQGRVIDGLQEAASGRATGHLGIKAYATEALW